MNNLCFLTNLTSSDMAAWAQAIVSSLAILVGALVVMWQTRRARLELCEREARGLDGLARLVIHIRDSAIEARAEKHKLERWPVGHPAEPSTRYAELAEAVGRYPLEAAHGEVSFEALLQARRATKEMLPLVGPEPELDVNPNYEATFQAYVQILNQQIELLRKEALNLMQGKRTRYSDETPAVQSA